MKVLINPIDNSNSLTCTPLSRTIVDNGGEEIIQNFMDNEKKNSDDPDFIVTGAGKLNYKFIIHVKIQFGNEENFKTNFQNIFEKVIIKANDLGCKSIGLPVFISGVDINLKDLCIEYMAETLLKILKMRDDLNFELIKFCNPSIPICQKFQNELMKNIEP